MKKLNLRLIFCATLIFLSLIFTFQLYAEIDMQTCVGVWLFDEGSGDIVMDSSGVNADGTINGAEWVDGKSGKALSFNGLDQFVEIPDSEELNPKNEMTMACWVYITGNENTHRDILSKDGENAERQYLLTASDVNTFRAHIWTSDGTANYFDGSTTVELETWYHVAQVYDGNVLTLYVNGEEDGSLNFSGEIIVTSQPFRIGGGANAGAAGYYTPGIIDEVAIFNVALEQDDIKTLMNSGMAGVLAVSSEGKMATVWSEIKTQE
ncbi:hypothetical protein GF312_10250 [Candidatus Poribacteria bacterium]|nr:hypothetical protein [Candidatus Poribacteria bacterium]